MLDIDNFKNINDTFGHHTGDKVLKNAAVFLKTIFENDCYEVFRIGGDEFAIIAFDVTTQQLEAKLLQLDAFEEEPLCEFSYGYALVEPSENNALENAFVRADSYMYAQKRNKKQTLCQNPVM